MSKSINSQSKQRQIKAIRDAYYLTSKSNKSDKINKLNNSNRELNDSIQQKRNLNYECSNQKKIAD